MLGVRFTWVLRFNLTSRDALSMGHSWDTCAQHPAKPDNNDQQQWASQGSLGTVV